MSGACSPKSLVPTSPSKSAAGESGSSSTSSSLVLSINVGRARSPLSELPIANFFPPLPSPVKSSHVSPSKRRNTLYFDATYNSMSPKRASTCSDAILTATRTSSPSSSTSSTPSSGWGSDFSKKSEESYIRKKRSVDLRTASIGSDSQTSAQNVSGQLRRLRVDRQEKSPRRKSSTPATPSHAATKAALAERTKREAAAKGLSHSSESRNSMDVDVVPDLSEERRKGKLRMRDMDEFEAMMEDEDDKDITTTSPSKVHDRTENWTVWQDNCEIVPDVIPSPTGIELRVEDDKENAKPDPVVLQGRRKGTGGRLSLVAQEDASSVMEEISDHENIV